MPPLPDYPAARDAARSRPRGTTLYPRQLILDGGRWARQDHPDGPYVILDPMPDPGRGSPIGKAA